jgi:hypothetical protein
VDGSALSAKGGKSIKLTGCSALTDVVGAAIMAGAGSMGICRSVVWLGMLVGVDEPGFDFVQVCIKTCTEWKEANI